MSDDFDDSPRVRMNINGQYITMVPKDDLDEALAKIERLKDALMSIKEEVGTSTWAWHTADEALKDVE